MESGISVLRESRSSTSLSSSEPFVVEYLEVTGLDTTQRKLAVKSVGCHILAIYGSMLIYRAFFHRLRKFPGPFLARLSNFHVAGLSAKKVQLYEETERLHKLYGDYVRLGKTISLFLLFRWPYSGTTRNSN